MTLAPLLNAPLVVQIHTVFAIFAVLLTVAIFSLPKGSRRHRTMGWIWVLSMGTIAISSFFIHTLRWVGPFSPIHFLSILVLISLVRGVHAARNHRVRAHKRIMKGMVLYGLLVAGAFTFLPGRLMHDILLGG